MKDIYQVLREKELAIARVRQEVEALRFCVPMLADDDATVNASPRTAPSSKHWPVEGGPQGSSGTFQN